MLARIASQKTIDASTLARIWMVERLSGGETRA
jgi:hypothetical protein